MVTTNWRIDTYTKEKSPNTRLNLDIRSQERRSQDHRRDEGQGKKKRLKKQIQNVLNVSKNIQIDNYLKGKWIKCFNQKTQTGWMYMKTSPKKIKRKKENKPYI